VHVRGNVCVCVCVCMSVFVHVRGNVCVCVCVKTWHVKLRPSSTWYTSGSVRRMTLSSLSTAMISSMHALSLSKLFFSSAQGDTGEECAVAVLEESVCHCCRSAQAFLQLCTQGHRGGVRGCYTEGVCVIAVRVQQIAAICSNLQQFAAAVCNYGIAAGVHHYGIATVMHHYGICYCSELLWNCYWGAPSCNCYCSALLWNCYCNASLR
jgi:hypothetical protein